MLSQPILVKIPSYNLLSAAVTLYSGNIYSRIAKFAELMNLQFYSHTVHDEVQVEYLVPKYGHIGTMERTTTQGRGQSSSNWRWTVRFTRLLSQILHEQPNGFRISTDHTVRACSSEGKKHFRKDGMDVWSS